MKSKPLYGYFAGGLFSNKDLCGHSMLANLIYARSNGVFLPILPQNLEQRDYRGAAIRSADLLALARADWAVFHFDGTELDSGTVVEHEFAKFLDIPSLLLRTDLRGGGDAGDLPWNLMNRPGPRGATVVIDAMQLYQKALDVPKGDSTLGGEDALLLLRASIRASEEMHCAISDIFIKKLWEVLSLPPILTPDELKLSLATCAKTVGEGFDTWLNDAEIEAITARRFG
jgi:nucleoside 2-deoxyribosyltransferase